MSTVGELRDLIEGLDDDTEIRVAEYGYRSSGYYYVSDVEIRADRRTWDDWGNRKDALGDVLFITLGDVADNRYPPSEDDVDCVVCGEPTDDGFCMNDCEV